MHVDLGNAPGRANTGDKMLTLVVPPRWPVATALTTPMCCAPGGTACTLGSTVKAPSTLGTFLRSFRWGHVRQLDRVSRELLARAWATGAGPGDGPLTIDLDSTICETSPLTNVVTRQVARQGVRRSCVPEHRAWAPKDSPVAPPDALPRATPAADIGVRSIRPRRPRTLDRSAAWNR